MNITNGTVSRTFKPADYEGRTVTLSFTMDPGDDAEACVAKALAMAERQAKMQPAVQEANIKPRKPPQVPVEVPAADPTSAGAVASAAQPIATSTPQPIATSVVTDAMLDAAVKKARAGNIAPEQIKAAIAVFTEQPGVSMKSLDDTKRPLLLAAIEALKPLPHNAAT